MAVATTHGYGRLFCSLAVTALCVAAVPAAAATYYVDGAAGSDSNSGLSETSAWRTVAEVNGADLSPGDTVLFRRGQSHDGTLDKSDDGSAEQPITFGAWGTGDAPILYRITLRGDHLIVQDVVVDHRSDAGDTVRIRGGRNITLRRMEIRNGTNDAIDADEADNLLIDTVEIHHHLAGSLGSGDDAHGITATRTNGVTIRNANIHHVSGDSFQADPNRTPGAITNNILIEDSELWTGPLAADFNSGWRAGDVPGENAVDTKVVTSGWESEPRMNITIRNVTAHGWQVGPAIDNRSAFNLKEKINAVLDRITVFDSEIAFRVRGGRGNANTLITNAVVYDVEKAIRAEDGLTDLRVYNSTFGNDIGTMIQQAGGSIDTGTWDMRNNAFVSEIPNEAPHESNLLATSTDFVAAGSADYRLTPGASLIDRGDTIAVVLVDRDGLSRSGAYDVGAYEASASGTVPKPPRIIQGP